MNTFNAILSRHVYGPFMPNSGPEHMADYIRSHYLYYRRKARLSPAKALAAALALPPCYVTGRGYYGATGGAGAPFQSGGETLRWIEETESVGLRYVGTSEKLAGLRHSGYYCDAYGGELITGHVWQLPGRKGKARLVYGYQEIESNGREVNPGSAAICLEVQTVDANDSDEIRESARFADGLAESVASDRREYNEAYFHGRDAGELDSEAIALRGELLPLLADFRQVRRGRAMISEKLTETLQEALRGKLSAFEAAREKRDSAWSDCPSYAESAWLDGFADESSRDRAIVLGWIKGESA